MRKGGRARPTGRASYQPIFSLKVVLSSCRFRPGPFDETREQLGGYYLVEAADLDEAIGLAARIPARRRPAVRPPVAHRRAQPGVAVAQAYGEEAGLQLLDQIAGRGELPGYHLLPAARADLLRRLGRPAEAAAAYRAALELAGNPAERRFLSRRLGELREPVEPSCLESNFPRVPENFPGSKSNFPRPPKDFPGPKSNFPRPPEDFPGPKSNFPRPPEDFPGPKSNFPRLPEDFPGPESIFPRLPEDFPRVPEDFGEVPGIPGGVPKRC